MIYIQVISFHRFLKNAQNGTSDISTLSLRGKTICIHVWQRKYTAFLQQRDQNNTLICCLIYKFLKTLVRMTVRAVANKNKNETQELVQQGYYNVRL